MMYRTFLVYLSALLLSACANTSIFLANAPTYWDGVERHVDIPFGAHGLKLDIYAPPNTKANKNYPVLVFIHGGRWSEGSKDIYKFVGSRFAKAGYITVIPDYRHYPDVKFPAFVHDNADAVIWAAENISRYGGDPQNLFIMGHSAGALNGALLVSDPRYLPEDISISAFVGLAGPYDFVPEDEDVKDIFGPPENYPQMQVTHFIDGSEPPMLLLHGLQDETVKMSNIEKLSPALEQNNIPYEIRTYNDLNHIDMVTSFVWIYAGKRAVLPDILGFLSAHSQKE